MREKETLNETNTENKGVQDKNTSENVQNPTKVSGNNNCCLSSEVSIAQDGNACQVRNLREDEIECKIAQIKDNQGVALLLYKTARTDILLLDETFGKMNWQCEYKEVKGNMYCGISVFDRSKNQWVTKWDCGVESVFGDKQKGEASDSFKRAGFKWGVGIELYTAPFVWIPSDKCNIRGGKCYDKFAIEKIATENKVIKGLAVRNISNHNQRVFVWQATKEKSEEN